MYQKNSHPALQTKSPQIVNSIKTADAIKVCFVKGWDDRGLCFCLHIVPKNAAPTMSFLEH